MASDDLRAALRDNRQGRVFVAAPLVSGARALLADQMMIVEERALGAGDVELFGYSPGFEVIELGGRAPLYTVIVREREGGICEVMGFHREAAPGPGLRLG